MEFATDFSKIRADDILSLRHPGKKLDVEEALRVLRQAPEESTLTVRAKCLLLAACSQYSLTEIGERMGGLAQQNVSRFLNLHLEYNPRMGTFVRFAKALGLTLQDVLQPVALEHATRRCATAHGFPESPAPATAQQRLAAISQHPSFLAFRTVALSELQDILDMLSETSLPTFHDNAALVGSINALRKQLSFAFRHRQDPNQRRVTLRVLQRGKAWEFRTETTTSEHTRVCAEDRDTTKFPPLEVFDPDGGAERPGLFTAPAPQPDL